MIVTLKAEEVLAHSDALLAMRPSAGRFAIAARALILRPKAKARVRADLDACRLRTMPFIGFVRDGTRPLADLTASRTVHLNPLARRVAGPPGP